MKTKSFLEENTPFFFPHSNRQCIDIDTYCNDYFPPDNYIDHEYCKKIAIHEGIPLDVYIKNRQKQLLDAEYDLLYAKGNIEDFIDCYLEKFIHYRKKLEQDSHFDVVADILNINYFRYKGFYPVYDRFNEFLSDGYRIYTNQLIVNSYGTEQTHVDLFAFKVNDLDEINLWIVEMCNIDLCEYNFNYQYLKKKHDNYEYSPVGRKRFLLDKKTELIKNLLFQKFGYTDKFFTYQEIWNLDNTGKYFENIAMM